MRDSRILDKEVAEIFKAATNGFRERKMPSGEIMYIAGRLASSLLALAVGTLSEEQIGGFLDHFLDMAKDDIKQTNIDLNKEKYAHCIRD